MLADLTSTPTPLPPSPPAAADGEDEAMPPPPQWMLLEPLPDNVTVVGAARQVAAAVLRGVAALLGCPLEAELAGRGPEAME